MATYLIDSKQDIAKAKKITQMIEDGTKAQPPALQGKANECAKCHKMTLLARFYIPGVGYGCEACFDAWRLTPVWCDTRASDAHRGRFHVALGLLDTLDKEPKNAPVARQDARSEASQPKAYDWVAERVEQIKKQRGDESVESERRWHASRIAAAARRNAQLGVKAA